MKNIITILIVMITLISCKNAEKKNDSKGKSDRNCSLIYPEVGISDAHNYFDGMPDRMLLEYLSKTKNEVALIRGNYDINEVDGFFVVSYTNDKLGYLNSKFTSMNKANEFIAKKVKVVRQKLNYINLVIKERKGDCKR